MVNVRFVKRKKAAAVAPCHVTSVASTTERIRRRSGAPLQSPRSRRRLIRSADQVMFDSPAGMTDPRWSPPSPGPSSLGRGEFSSGLDGVSGSSGRLRDASSSKPSVNEFVTKAARSPAERLRADQSQLEEFLRRREQQLAAITLTIRAKRSGTTTSVSASLEELEGARRKLEVDLFRARQALFALQHQAETEVIRSKVALEELDAALGIQDAQGLHKVPQSFAAEQKPRPTEHIERDDLTLNDISLALQKLRREEAEQRIGETRVAIRKALHYGAELASLFREPERQGLDQVFDEALLMPFQDRKPSDLPRTPKCTIFASDTELAHKRRRLEMAPTRDYVKVLQPDAHTPFLNKVDAWQRLQPYHVFLGEVKSPGCGLSDQDLLGTHGDKPFEANLREVVVRAEQRFSQLLSRYETATAKNDVFIETKP
jgi:hypothetical protein